MKRFYCTTCKKAKRVRRLPADVEYAGPETPLVGTCRWHTAKTHRSFLQGTRVQPLNRTRYIKAAPAPPPPKAKRAKRTDAA